jgi:hypothetical protein
VRWFGLFGRRRRGRHHYPLTTTDRVGSWAAVGVPPSTSELVTNPVEPLSAAGPTRVSVRLGFVDGSSVDIDDASGTSEALRAMASRLLRPTDC